MNLSTFDAEELLHLAGSFLGQRKPANALECLKRASQLEPANAKVLYLTAVVYCQTGLVKRAVQSLEQAIQIDPELSVAHFQFGLLLYGTERYAEASAAWAPLDRLGQEHALVLLKTGMEALAREEYELCRHYINRGIERNTENEALNEEMRKILKWAAEQQSDADEDTRKISFDPNIKMDSLGSSPNPAIPKRRTSKVPPLPEKFRGKSS